MGLSFQLWRGGVVEKGKERSFVVVDYSVRARRCGPLFKRDTWGIGIGHNHSVSILENCTSLQLVLVMVVVAPFFCFVFN